MRVPFASIPLVLSFGPISLKLEFDTHLGHLESDDDDDDNNNNDDDKKLIPLITDTNTIADVTSRMTNMVSIIEYQNHLLNGLLRLLLLLLPI